MVNSYPLPYMLFYAYVCKLKALVKPNSFFQQGRRISVLDPPDELPGPSPE